MGKIISKVTDAVGITDSKAGQRSADASLRASDAAYKAQMEALDYLKQQNALPTKVRDDALRQYQSSVNDPSSFLTGIKEGGLYSALLEGQEDAALRARSAVGGLRGGGSIADVGQVQNQALMNAYNQKLQGLGKIANLGTNENTIAGLMTQGGQTQAQGIIGAAQGLSAGRQQNISNLMGLGQLGIGAGMLFSDGRLKRDITKISSTPIDGINKYSWFWNDKANSLNLHGVDYGYLADEVALKYPHLVELDYSGYNKVNYEELNKIISRANNG